MQTFVVLLRAVNVGGTGKLPMADLKALCVAAGFERVQTYIASGNVVLDSTLPASGVKSVLEARLQSYAGQPVGVLVRSAEEIAGLLAANPFSTCQPERTVVIFLDEPPAVDALARVSGCRNEQLQLGAREIYVHYADGIGRSKLKIPAAKAGTARNINTITRLVQMAAEQRGATTDAE